MELALTYLAEGISWWHQEITWPRDFHNAVYHELYDLKKNGLSGTWWDKTVDRLWTWKAIRPKSKAEIKERGIRVLPQLQKMHLNLCEKTEDEPLFLNFTWQQIVDFYNLISNIKASNSPVFPSKLGHFIFPKLFIVMDNKATSTHDYKDFWQSMHEAWSSFVEKAEAKRILLKEIHKYSTKIVHDHYPFEVKIIELCVIGKNKKAYRSQRKTLETAADFRNNSVMRRKGVTMKEVVEEFSCKNCRLSIARLKEMAEDGGQKEMFTTFSGRNMMNIYEVDDTRQDIVDRIIRQDIVDTGPINVKGNQNPTVQYCPSRSLIFVL